MRVRYAALAADEVERILAYLHERSPLAADRVRLRLLEIERLLGQFPLVGVPMRLRWLRRIPVREHPYIVFYEAWASDVMVLAVRHSARDPSSMPGTNDPPSETED